MTPVPPPNFAPPEEPPLSPWLGGHRGPALSPSHAAMPVTMSGAPVRHSARPESMPPESTATADPLPAAASQSTPAQSVPERPAPPKASETTLHGLPIRVPMARLPAEALAVGNEPVASATPTERDPEKVSASMAAYGRGLTGRPGSPPPASAPSTSQSPYPPMPSSGNS
jgi:hypothetical protein